MFAKFRAALKAVTLCLRAKPHPERNLDKKVGHLRRVVRRWLIRARLGHLVPIARHVPRRSRRRCARGRLRSLSLIVGWWGLEVLPGGQSKALGVE